MARRHACHWTMRPVGGIDPQGRVAETVAADAALYEHAAESRQGETAPRTARQPVQSEHAAAEDGCPAFVFAHVQRPLTVQGPSVSFELSWHCLILQLYSGRKRFRD